MTERSWIRIQETVSLHSLFTIMQRVSSVESKASHPLAATIVDYGRSLSIEPKPEKVTEFENFPGEGICGKIDGRVLYIGNKKIATRAGSETVPTFQGESQRGKTIGYIYSGATPVGLFSLSDACRSGVQEAIEQLKLLGIKTAMLTGDSQSAAMQAQEQLGHALELVHAELLPEDKVKIISEFKKEGPTAMIGDGVNDAPALATADIGISMGISGSALASETGNVILMSNDIRKIPEAIKLARKSRRKVIENIIFSVITKASILGLAIAGHPLVWAAVLADVGTCLVVILNSMLLLQRGHKHGGKCCRSSTKLHIHKKGCDGTNDSSSHHHHHHQHHSHKHCCSDKSQKMSQPQKCASQTCSSKFPPCPSNSSLGGSVNHRNIMESHDQCKGSEFHEADHCHHGRCDKSQDGSQKHDAENEGCLDSHYLILNAEHNGAVAINRKDNCLGHKDHGTKHCHNQNIDMVSHDSASLTSPCHLNISCQKESQQFTNKHCHLIHGCEKLKDHESKKTLGSNHDTQHKKSGCHSDSKKCETGEISIDIVNEHVESALMHGCLSSEEKENGSCCKGCSDTCEKLPVLCACESSNEKEVSACCGNECSSKDSKESPIVNACISLDKREVGGCCKSYMKECCAKHGHSGAGLVGGLSEIITE